MRFQILYQLNSKSNHSILEADSFQNVKQVFNDLMVGELLEIREYVHEDLKNKKDDKNYIHSATFRITSLNKYFINSFRVPKIKKTLDQNQLVQYVHNFIKLNSVNPHFVDVKMIYK
jgi:cytochrome oxidase Cu insertion factor (SCO1/SenC/PrrC family)